jgi:hypothetical protein
MTTRLGAGRPLAQAVRSSCTLLPPAAKMLRIKRADRLSTMTGDVMGVETKDIQSPKAARCKVEAAIS